MGCSCLTYLLHHAGKLLTFDAYYLGLSDRRWRLLLVRHAEYQGMGSYGIIRRRLVDLDRQLDRDLEYQLLGRAIDFVRYLAVERGFRPQCLADGPHVLGRHVDLRERQCLWLEISESH